MNIMQYLGRGVYHEDNGVPCQDRAHYRYADNGNLILAISDGCSSAKYAEKAAETNIETVIKLFSGMTLREFLDRNKNAADIIDPLLAALKKKEPRRFDKDPTEFSATLLFVVTDGKEILTGHIGDGNILCAKGDGTAAYYSEEENAGSADRTFFTVSPDAKAHLRLTLLPADDVTNVMLYSDGPQKMLWYRGDRDIQKAALELAGRVHAGEIANCAQLADALADMTADAMYQLMDDWSMLVLDKEQKQCGDMLFDAVSMKQRFMKTFDKIIDVEQEGPECS